MSDRMTAEQDAEKMPPLPALPPVDTSSLAWSGRSVDYINGYESGYESAADQMREYGQACYQAATLAAQARPVHPNHRADLRYVLAVLEKVRDLALPTFHKEDAAHGEVAAAINGMNYILKRTEEEVTAQARTAEVVQRAVEAMTQVCRNFPTDSDMAEAGWATKEINAACDAYDLARASITELQQHLGKKQ
jgi:hypothetical protein